MCNYFQRCRFLLIMQDTVTEPPPMYPRHCARHSETKPCPEFTDTQQRAPRIVLVITGFFGKGQGRMPRAKLRDVVRGTTVQPRLSNCQKRSPPPLNTHRPQIRRLREEVLKSDQVYLNKKITGHHQLSRV